MRKKNIAIIPARGGSKRIPRKNIIDFFGKPLIAWTIEAAKQSGIFDRILVTTDEEEIAAVARGLGVEVPFLRDSHADDQSPVSQASIVALQQAKKLLNEDYENVIQLMANCPLRTSYEITEAYNHFVANDYKSQISCFKFGWMNPWWAVTLNSSAQPSYMFPEARQKRSQDLEDLFCPTGAIWIAKVDNLLGSGTFYDKEHTFYPIPWQSAVDIDDASDLEMAKAIFMMRYKC